MVNRKGRKFGSAEVEMSIIMALAGGIVGWLAGAWLLVWGAGNDGDIITLNLWWLVLAELLVAMGAGVPAGFAMKSAGEDLDRVSGTRIGIAVIGAALTVMVAYFAHVNAAALAAEAAGEASAWLDHLSLSALPELHLRGRWNMDFAFGWTAGAATLLGAFGTHKMADVAEEV